MQAHISQEKAVHTFLCLFVKVCLHAKFRWHASICGWVLTTSGSKNGHPPYWNSTSCLYLDLFIVIGMTNCIGVPDFIRIRQRRGYDVISIFQDGGNNVRNLTSGCGFSDGSRLGRSKSISIPNFVEISIHIIPTPGFGKQMTAISEFDFRFLIWSHASLCRAVLYIPTKFRRRVTIYADVIRIYQKFNIASAAIMDLAWLTQSLGWPHTTWQLPYHPGSSAGVGRSAKNVPIGLPVFSKYVDFSLPLSVRENAYSGSF